MSSLAPAGPKVMTEEHSIAGLMPYISYYLPEATVFSVIVRHKIPDEEVEAFAADILKIFDQDTVLIASVDFSHYLPMAVAERRDEYTKQILLDMQEHPLYTLNNDYMDSPGSIGLMFKICKSLGAKNFSITGHANSATIFKDPLVQSTTSYFTGYCQER